MFWKLVPPTLIGIMSVVNTKLVFLESQRKTTHHSTRMSIRYPPSTNDYSIFTCGPLNYKEVTPRGYKAYDYYYTI
jgi:hypothetical protein